MERGRPARPDGGRDLRMGAVMRATLVKCFTFEAAHLLPYMPEGHKCRRLHGHSYVVEVSVEGEVDARTGLVMDYGEITEAVKPFIEQLDHRYLNEIPGLENSTSEVLAKWLWDRIRPALRGVVCISVAETCSARCEYRGN
jgi:6-pyruvoyltetrahydropterin/6-carboxytetrahydropterin synthase